MQDLTLRRNLSGEGFPFVQAPFHFAGFSHNDIEWEGRIDFDADLCRLIQLISARHDNEDIDIAVIVRGA